MYPINDSLGATNNFPDCLCFHSQCYIFRVRSSWRPCWKLFTTHFQNLVVIMSVDVHMPSFSPTQTHRNRVKWRECEWKRNLTRKMGTVQSLQKHLCAAFNAPSLSIFRPFLFGCVENKWLGKYFYLNFRPTAHQPTRPFVPPLHWQRNWFCCLTLVNTYFIVCILYTRYHQCMDLVLYVSITLAEVSRCILLVRQNFCARGVYTVELGNKLSLEQEKRGSEILISVWPIFILDKR